MRAIGQGPAQAPREGPSRARRAPPQAAIAAAVALLGFLLATQLRVHQGLGQRLAIERESDLVRILSDLSARSDDLLEEIVDLRIQLAEAQTSTERTQVLIQNAADELESLEILLGTVPVRGPGVRIVVTDPESAVGPDALVDVLQELRDAGAEAVQVGGVRVVASTAVTGRPGALSIGGRSIRAPYVVEAVGSRETLAEAMRIPGGVVDSIQSHPGATVRVAEMTALRIASLQRAPTFSYARPSERGSRSRR